MSSGGTARELTAAGLPVTTVEQVTGAPEMLEHRVVTLHPKIHGGILADLDKDSHRADLDRHGIEPFSLVVSNLYPFVERPDIETIDVGGPTMVRAAAKNHAHVGIVTSPSQYDAVLAELRAHDGTLTDATRRALALEAFAHTAAYDAAIVGWLQQGELLPQHLVVALDRTDEQLRYGENPHQQGARYRIAGTTSWWDGVHQHSGLALSYLNLYDADAAWRLVHDLVIGGADRPACAIIKHANPCGVAVAGDLATAYQRALECDERSAFGGIVAVNRPIDAATVERMVAGPQADVVIAPAYETGTLDALIAKRKNTRLLDAPAPEPVTLDYRQICGGFLVQEPHHFAATRDDWRVVTKRAPTDERVARRRARVAGVRPREVERDRAREGRPGGRHRRRPAEPGRVGRDRGQEGGGPRGGRRRARATRSTRSPTASRPRPTPASPSSCNPAGPCATSRTSNVPTSSASRWCSPENGTSSIESK